MYELTHADRIWNRACGEDAVQSLPGDRALTDLLYAHGYICNGGILHAIECLTPAEQSAAQAGYRFYGFEMVASLLDEARIALESGDDGAEYRLSGQYKHLLPDLDTSIATRFEQHFADNPSDYATLRSQDLT